VNLQSLDQVNAAYRDSEQSTEETFQHPLSSTADDAVPCDFDQPTAEPIGPPETSDASDGIGHGAAQHDTEQSVESLTQETPEKAGTDSGYNSPQDETSAWEKILEMREREHQNDLAAMQDEHDDEMKYLRGDLSSETRKKELLQKRVKKEVLAKQDLKQQLEILHGDHQETLEEVLALRVQFEDMKKGFQDKEETYLETVKVQEDGLKTREEDIHNLRMRIYDLNGELLNKERSHQEAIFRLGANAHNIQNREGAPSAQWGAQMMQLEICKTEREQAISYATNFHAQLELAKTANGKLLEELDAKREDMEVDARYHEQIRGQNWDLQNRINESMADVATLKYQKAKAEQDAAAEVKDRTRKLDNRTAELSALEATRAEWQADPEGVLLTLSKGVTSDAMILALAKRFQLTLNENDGLTQSRVVQEQEYDALNRQLRRMTAQRDGLSQSLAEKAEEVTSLKDKIHELETIVLSREMDDEADKRAEPLYLQAVEEIRQLKEALSEKCGDAVDPGTIEIQLNQARRTALQNRQQHVAEVESLKDLIEKVYERMLRVEATLTAAGRTIEEPNNEGEVLKAQCARVLGYDEDESESAIDGPDGTSSRSDTSKPSNAESQSHGHEDKAASQSSDTAYDKPLTNGTTNQPEHESDVKSEVEIEHSSDTPNKKIVRRFVLRALAENGTRIRVLGEPSSPAVPPTPHSNALRAEDVQDLPSDRDDGSGGDGGSEDLQINHPPPLPVASLAWVKKNRPFGYGEPVEDDQFGKEPLRARP